MEMELLLKKVKKELDTIADKGITSSNLETTNKLVDIYKDIKEICHMEDEDDSYNARSTRRSMNRYDDYRDDRYSNHPLDDRTERYFKRMREGMEDYSEGRNRYRDSGSDARMVDGIEMTMSAILNFIESLMDIAETSQEKEIVRRYVNKIRNV